jgi:hypothetical protein
VRLSQQVHELVDMQKIEIAELCDLHRYPDTLAIVASTLFVLRHRRRGERNYSMFGYPLIPAFYIVCPLGIAARVLTLNVSIALAGIGILLTSWPLFWLRHGLFEGQWISGTRKG